MKRTQRPHRKKELNELQTLKEENKNLRSENRNLRKRLKRLERKEHSFVETQYTDPEEDTQLPLFTEEKERCLSCGKGTLIYYNVVGRAWSECDQCDFRTKTIKTALL